MRTLVSLTYDDVLLVPQYSDIRSRQEIDIGTTLGGRHSRPIRFKLPIISSPMDTVTGPAMANAINKAGGLGIIHRYCSTDEQAKMIRKVNRGMKAAAIGVTGDYLDRAKALVAMGAHILCVDVAHGHHVLMEGALKSLRDTFGDTIHIMAGNVATIEGINALSDWGADSVRCNIGGGSICSTRIQTGHGHPGLQTVVDCSKTDRDVSIIADGGITCPGDVSKAFGGCADFVMMGGQFAGHDQNPGKVIEKIVPGHPNELKKYKCFYGMSSKQAMETHYGKMETYRASEGRVLKIPYKGDLNTTVQDYLGGLRSTCTYINASTMKNMAKCTTFIRVSQQVNDVFTKHTS